MSRYCTKCGAINDETAQYCTTCQAALTSVGTAYQAPPGTGYQSPVGGYQPLESVYPPGLMTDWKSMGADKKIPAGICAILVGWLGVHKFLLGYTTEGIIQLVLGIVSCGLTSILSIIEGIIYLTKSDEEFVRTYIQNKKGWF